jgi:CubicO group peptidase (beta-lactamase class C family)
MAFGVGFQLQTEIMAFGPPPDAYGHRGAGGSVHGVWPTERIGVSYAMNQLRASQMVDPRADALLTSLYSAVKRQEG